MSKCKYITYLLDTLTFDTFVFHYNQSHCNRHTLYCHVHRSESRLKHGHSAVLLLAVLVQFRKNESTNPYKLKLSILDQELALHGYGQVITHSLATYTQAFEASCSGSYAFYRATLMVVDQV